MALLHGEARLAPGLDPTIHRQDIGISHLPYTIRRQCGSIAAAAIQHDWLLLIRNDGFDIPLDHSLAEVNRTCSVVLRILTVLTYIDEVKWLSPIQSCLYV